MAPRTAEVTTLGGRRSMMALNFSLASWTRASASCLMCWRLWS
ncbi:hypothetical protein AMA2_15 [Achromobacter phage AMA2]|nr:hypothetical protein AMA2_15 [Achromobacter phage AMA2]